MLSTPSRVPPQSRMSSLSDINSATAWFTPRTTELPMLYYWRSLCETTNVPPRGARQHWVLAIGSKLPPPL